MTCRRCSLMMTSRVAWPTAGADWRPTGTSPRPVGSCRLHLSRQSAHYCSSRRHDWYNISDSNEEILIPLQLTTCTSVHYTQWFANTPLKRPGLSLVLPFQTLRACLTGLDGVLGLERVLPDPVLPSSDSRSERKPSRLQ